MAGSILIKKVVIRPVISRKKFVKCNKCMRGGYGDKSCPIGGHIKSAKIGCYEGKEYKNDYRIHGKCPRRFSAN